MSPRAEFWVIIIALAAGTYAMRVVPILAYGRISMPGWLERFLRHVPAAALTALIVPGVLYVHRETSYELAPARILAAAVALLVAWRWRNMFATLVFGMAALWVFQALL